MTIGPLGDEQGIVIVSHLRFAAGGCVVATGLLLSGAGGAIAGADTGTTRSSGVDGTSQSSTAADSTQSNPIGRLTDTLRRTVRGVTTTLGSVRQQGLGSFTGGKNSQILSAGATDVTKNTTVVDQGSNPITFVPTVVQSLPNAPAPNNVATNPVAPLTNTVAEVPQAVTSLTSTVPQVSTLVGPATNVVSQLPTVVAPVTNAVTAVPADLIASGTAVLTSFQNLVNTLTGGGFAQLPSDLASLLGITNTTAAVNAAQVVDGPGLAAAVASLPAPPATATATATASRTSLSSLLLGGVADTPFVGDTARLTKLGSVATTTHLSLYSSVTATGALAPTGTSLMNVQLHLGQAVGAFLRSASLAELAVVALPGLCGLLFFTAAGVGIGHRQAKAGFALQTAGIARFARTGPLGVVRSGSLVVLHRRTARTARRATRNERLLADAA